jgi:histone deacetylase 11
MRSLVTNPCRCDYFWDLLTGNGHERDHLGDPDTYIFDVYNSEIYPHDTYAKKGIAEGVPIVSGTADDEYIAMLRKRLPKAIKAFKPDALIYNAGTDCMVGDPLGMPEITLEPLPFSLDFG